MKAGVKNIIALLCLFSIQVSWGDSLWDGFEEIKNSTDRSLFFDRMIDIFEAECSVGNEDLAYKIHLNQAYFHFLKLKSDSKAVSYYKRISDVLSDCGKEKYTPYLDLSYERYSQFRKSLNSIDKSYELLEHAGFSYKNDDITGLYFYVNIGGNYRLFTFDSGAPHCFIPQKFAGDSFKTHKSNDQEFLFAKTAKIGDLDISGMGCKVMPGAQANFGILGLDLLAAVNSLCIEKSESQVSRVALNSTKCKKGKYEVPIRFGLYELVHAQVKVAQSRYEFRIDTGASYSILKSPVLNSIKRDIEKPNENMGFWLADESRRKLMGKLADLCIETGGYTYSSLVYVDDKPKLIPVSWGKDRVLSGNLGANFFFSANSFYWDFYEGKIYLSSGTPSPERCSMQ